MIEKPGTFRGGADLIRRFEHGRDTIPLQFLDADTTAAGRQAFTFVGGGGLGGATGRLRVAGSTVEGDVDGDGRADLVIEVQSNGGLDAGDFLL